MTAVVLLFLFHHLNKFLIIYKKKKAFDFVWLKLWTGYYGIEIIVE